MSFLPLHRDKEHKFKKGYWSWSEDESAELKFNPHEPDKKTKSRFNPLDWGLEFKKDMDVAEEKIFRETFQRKKLFCDSDIVTLQDVKNLAIFLLTSNVTTKFLEVVHDETFDKFLYSSIFYIDLFLMVLELLLIRRDKKLEEEICDKFTLKVEQFLAKRLSDRRLLVAREYSKVSISYFYFTAHLTKFRFSDPLNVQ